MSAPTAERVCEEQRTADGGPRPCCQDHPGSPGWRRLRRRPRGRGDARRTRITVTISPGTGADPVAALVGACYVASALCSAGRRGGAWTGQRGLGVAVLGLAAPHARGHHPSPRRVRLRALASRRLGRAVRCSVTSFGTLAVGPSPLGRWPAPPVAPVCRAVLCVVAGDLRRRRHRAVGAIRMGVRARPRRCRAARTPLRGVMGGVPRPRPRCTPPATGCGRRHASPSSGWSPSRSATVRRGPSAHPTTARGGPLAALPARRRAGLTIAGCSSRRAELDWCLHRRGVEQSGSSSGS